MEYLLEKMIQLADKLDKNNLAKETKLIDSCIKTAGLIKQAQYVGIQGYWLKQERCLVNCYNTKRRLSSGKRSPHECIFECLDEYNDSMTKSVETDTWSKFAQVSTSSGQADSIQGDNTGSVDGHVTTGKEILKKLDNLQEKRKASTAKFDDIKAFFREAKNIETELYINNSIEQLKDNLIQLGESLDKKGMLKESDEVTNLIKEAQLWRSIGRGLGIGASWIGSLFGGDNRTTAVLKQRLDYIVKDVQELFGAIFGTKTYKRNLEVQKKVISIYKTMQNYIKKLSAEDRFDAQPTKQPPQQKTPESPKKPMVYEQEPLGAKNEKEIKTAQGRGLFGFGGRSISQIHDDLTKQLNSALRELMALRNRPEIKDDEDKLGGVSQLIDALNALAYQTEQARSAIAPIIIEEQSTAGTEQPAGQEQAQGQLTPEQQATKIEITEITDLLNKNPTLAKDILTQLKQKLQTAPPATATPVAPVTPAAPTAESTPAVAPAATPAVAAAPAAQKPVAKKPAAKKSTPKKR